MMSVPVTRSVAQEHYAEAGRKMASERRSDAWLKRALALGCLAFAGGWGWSSYNAGKLAEQVARKEIVYVTIRDDGAITNSVHYSALAPEIQADPTLNSLWTYVWNRECFRQADAAAQWNIVQSMSDPRVGREFKDWFRRTNPQSPQVIYGQKGIRVDCEFVGLVPVPNGDETYQVRFDRTEVGQQGSGKTVRYTATVRYRTGVYDPDPKRGWVARVTYNAPGVQVWDYPGARPEGGVPSYRAVAQEVSR